MGTLFPIATCTLLMATAAAMGQGPTVEFRIVERDSQTFVPLPPGSIATTDNVLNFAVQARVVNGGPTDFLGNFSFDIVAAGERDANGTFSKLLISNADGTYAANVGNTSNATVGRGGLAAIYTYLAGIGPNFNGLLNVSAGTFTNTASSQEIGLITGSPTGNSLLLLTDPTNRGAPDTWPGFGPSAPIDPAIAATYLGAAGNFVDVYRFKYTVTNLTTTRLVNFNLANITAQAGVSLQLVNGVWGPVQFNVPATATG